MEKSKILFFLIIFLAVITRVPFLDGFPNGFSGDEASQGYTAYSILKTGRDEWGEFLPLNPRSFGDFKPPLYTYLTVPSVGLFGLSEGAVRLPSAIIGILTVIIVYFLTREILGLGEFFSEKERKAVSLLSAFLLAVSPWHIQ
ncbi:MAG: glycosyltransferase family 39 protein, partial [bacterium]|nr:glycosyltransferase family 39 protein [bacterium]